ncbi:GAF domain-containing protein, partial [Colletotrichum eremochloae]
VHADASNFANGVTKEEAYEQVLLQAEGLFDGQRNWTLVTSSGSHSCPTSNLSNAASLLWHAYHSLPQPSASVNWAGFYVLDPRAAPGRPSLILGPFMGKVACQTIPFGRGVCGAAAATRETQVVPDVDAFPGHIACDGDSKSEVVVPVVDDAGRLVAIIDVDCAVASGFDDVDRVWLEKLAALLAKSCDW